MQAKKDKKTKAHLKIGVDFLEKKLLDFQVKLFEVDERHEARCVEYCAGEELKERKWPSTAVKAGDIFAVDIANVVFQLYVSSLFHTCHCLLVFGGRKNALRAGQG